MEPLLIWGLLLLAVAAGLVVVELFVPTAGLLGLTSLVIAVAGVVCLFRYSTVWGIVGSLLVVIGGPMLFALGFKIMPHTPVGRKLILGASEAEDAPPQPQGSPLEKLVGSEGMVLSDLRPIGVIRIGDKKFDAISETTLIRSGATVRVTAIDGLNLKVRPA